MALSRVVHKFRKGTIDALCGQPHTEKVVYATLAHGRGYRWCKKCVRRQDSGGGQGRG